MKFLSFVLTILLPCLALASVIDYGPPQDVLGHWEFDLYDFNGNQRGIVTNPIFISPKLPLTGNSPNTYTATTTSGQMLAANTSRHGLVVTNLGSGIVYFGLGVTAVVGSGIALLPGGVWVMDDYTFTQQAINVIGSVSSAIAYQELQ